MGTGTNAAQMQRADKPPYSTVREKAPFDGGVVGLRSEGFKRSC